MSLAMPTATSKNPYHASDRRRRNSNLRIVFVLLLLLSVVGLAWWKSNNSISTTKDSTRSPPQKVSNLAGSTIRKTPKKPPQHPLSSQDEHDHGGALMTRDNHVSSSSLSSKQKESQENESHHGASQEDEKEEPSNSQEEGEDEEDSGDESNDSGSPDDSGSNESGDEKNRHGTGSKKDESRSANSNDEDESEGGNEDEQGSESKDEDDKEDSGSNDKDTADSESQEDDEESNESQDEDAKDNSPSQEDDEGGNNSGDEDEESNESKDDESKDGDKESDESNEDSASKDEDEGDDESKDGDPGKNGDNEDNSQDQSDDQEQSQEEATQRRVVDSAEESDDAIVVVFDQVTSESSDEYLDDDFLMADMSSSEDEEVESLSLDAALDDREKSTPKKTAFIARPNEQTIQQLRERAFRDKSKARNVVVPVPETKTRTAQELVGNDGSTTYFVGAIGEKVIEAKTYGMMQRNVGFPEDLWEAMRTSTCWTNATASGEVLSSDLLGQQTWVSQARAKGLLLPTAILIGVQKGGTTSLHRYLTQHPGVITSQKELYFLDEYIDQVLRAQLSASKPLGLPQTEIRQAYAAVMTKAARPYLQSLADSWDSAKVLLDMTPNYIFESHRLPQRIACILPWAKLFALLRDPVERARSNYDMKLRFSPTGINKHGHQLPTLDEYIQRDLDALYETGVLQDWTKVDFDDFFGSPAQIEAWRTYENCGLNAPVGMGLYVLQIVPFWEALETLGRPKADLMLVASEQLRKEPSRTMERIQDFLGLPHKPLKQYPALNSAVRQGGASRMSPDLEAKLRKVFEPFNRKLAELVGSQDWPADIWEAPAESTVTQ